MKTSKVLFAFLLVMVCGIAPSYSQDYMDKIVTESCNCMEQIPDSLDKQESLMYVGTCMINASMPYKKKLKADFGINLDNIDNEAGEELGKIVGLRMVNKCPKALMRIANLANEPEKGDSEKEVQADSKIFTGTVTAIENEPFVVFSIKDDLGKSSRFFWLNFVQCDSDLVEHYSTLVGSTVKIQYSTSEFFDPKINEYRQFNIIQSVNIFK
jgi:hypothetical protein